MAKRISDEERVLAFFKTASQIDVISMLRTAAAVSDVRFPSEKPEKQKRGRPAKVKAAATSEHVA